MTKKILVVEDNEKHLRDAQDFFTILGEVVNVSYASSFLQADENFHLIDEKSNFAILVDPTKGLRKFDFDNVFHQYVSQESVYTTTSMPLIAEFINGFNVSCIVYGQTGR